MIKKFIALSLAVLLMASHMVSAYADDLPSGITMHDDIDQWTTNGVTGKIYPYPNNPHYQTFYASTSTPGRSAYISAQIILENAVNNAHIGGSKATATNWDYIDASANATYGDVIHVRVTGIHQFGSSENNITTAFGVRKVYRL